MIRFFLKGNDGDNGNNNNDDGDCPNGIGADTAKMFLVYIMRHQQRMLGTYNIFCLCIISFFPALEHLKFPIPEHI